MSDISLAYESIQRVALKNIDHSDREYKISVQKNFSELCKSIEMLGLIHPPTVQKIESNNSSYRVVSGFQRISACQHLNIKSIPCHVLSKDLSSFDCAKRAIADNTCQRPLSILEQSRSIALIKKKLPLKASFKTEAKNLGLPTSKKAMKQISPLCFMIQSIQDGIENDYIALPVAHSLSQLSDKDANTLSNLFFQLRPGLNFQREILTYCFEISKRDKITINEILKNKDLDLILSYDWDRKQKILAIRNYLKCIRYPEYTNMEKKVEEQIRKLKFSTLIKLSPPKYFEGNSYLLQVTFENTAELQHSLADVLSKTNAIEDILNIGN